MSSERPTVRPVTLTRLVEVTSLATTDDPTDAAIADELDVTERRAREAVLEAIRLDLIEETADEPAKYRAKEIGGRFIDSVEEERWHETGRILEERSPHYSAFVDCVTSDGPIGEAAVLEGLKASADDSQYEYNETSLDVLCDWSQRLGTVQRNVFTGSLYTLKRHELPEAFPEAVVARVESLETTASVALTQRYISIPELRETFCESFGLPRSVFDDGLVSLAEQNVGRLELSGAPIDTGAKDARFGIKEIHYTEDDGLVSTDHSSEQVMSGVELRGKQYYYLAIHDDNLQYSDQ